MPCIALPWLSRVILSYPKWLPSGIQPQVTGLKRGEVWWVNLDPTQGSEIQKTRPAVILTVNALNRARRTVVVVPLSSFATPRPPIVVSAPSGNLEKPVTFMVRQAHHERNLLIEILPFALSLSKCGVFRGPLLPGLALSRFATKSRRLTSPGLPNVLAKYPNPT